MTVRAGVVAVAVAAGLAAVSLAAPVPPPVGDAESPPAAAPAAFPPYVDTISAGGDPSFPEVARADWVTEENARPGTRDWWIDQRQLPRGTWIEGFTEAVSAQPGDRVRMAVSTNAATFVVNAYRLGWYGGTRARLVWTSAPVPGVVQPRPVLDAATGMVEARWPWTLTVPIARDWPPGAYLFKLVDDNGAQQWVPFTVRDDGSIAHYLVVQAVSTWQAYNTWGGCSLYVCPEVRGRSRAVQVSFDRPYTGFYNLGSADLLDHELSLIALVEQLGLDVTYTTSVDVDLAPGLALGHRAILSLGHDEYVSRNVRRAYEAGRDTGVHLAFLGANAVYRQIRHEPGWDGRPARRVVNYRSTRDPITAVDPKLATVEWRSPPVGEPENALIGVMYACANMRGSWKVTRADHWIYQGTGLRNGDLILNVIANEYDHVVRNRVSPPGLEVVAHSPVVCQGREGFHDATVYRAGSGALVVATGTIHWICSIDGFCTDRRVAPTVRRMTINILRAFADPPG